MKIDRLELVATIFVELVFANLGLYFKVFEFKHAICLPIGGAAVYLLMKFVEANEEYYE